MTVFAIDFVIVRGAVAGARLRDRVRGRARARFFSLNYQTRAITTSPTIDRA